jgi:hypothetical protein
MNSLFLTLVLVSILGLLAGLTRPRCVRLPSRKFVGLLFGGSTVIFFVLFGLTSTPVPAAIPSVTTVAKVPVLIGFGATLPDWNANHTADQNPKLFQNSVYNPDPNSKDPSDRYFAVTFKGGRALQYEMRLPEKTTIDQAKAIVLKDFPNDASVIWYNPNAGQCALMEVQSKILATVLSTPSIGAIQGEVFIEFGTYSSDKDTYDPANINDIILQLGSYQNASEAPNC